MAEEANLPSVFEFSADISSQEAPPPLPPRTYLAQITGAVAKVSQKSGNTYADIEFTVPTDQFPPDFAAGQTEPVKLHFRSLTMNDTPQARYRIRKFCESIKHPAGREFDLNSLVGKMAQLTVKNSTYQGEPRAEIDKIEPL